jgi:hypothetical protein
MDESKATIEDVEPRADEAAPEPDRPTPRVDPSDLAIALSPRQILGGFALLAALVMLLRRNRDRDRGERD